MTIKCLSTLLACLLFGIGVSAQAAISKDAYKAQEQSIKQTYDTAQKQCDSLSGNAKDVCEKQAKANRDVAQAENEAAYKDTVKARTEVLQTKAKAQYSVDNEKCDDLAGNSKDICEQEAKAKRDKALADVDARQTIVETKNKAAQEKHKADYKVALEKCDVLSGDAKTNCVDQAKHDHGM